ncbi:hypothetical protein GCM10027051_16530 [Niabella terrae]
MWTLALSLPFTFKFNTVANDFRALAAPGEILTCDREEIFRSKTALPVFAD